MTKASYDEALSILNSAKDSGALSVRDPAIVQQLRNLTGHKFQQVITVSNLQKVLAEKNPNKQTRTSSRTSSKATETPTAVLAMEVQQKNFDEALAILQQTRSNRKPSQNQLAQVYEKLAIADPITSPLAKAKTVAEAKAIIHDIYSPNSPTKVSNPIFEVPRMRSLSN